jgi:hypothetical protein
MNPPAASSFGKKISPFCEFEARVINYPAKKVSH